jgi:hypothetical protein
MKTFSHGPRALFVCAILAATVSAQAGEQTPSIESKQTVQPESEFKIYGWIEGGVTANPADPRDHQNFGRLFTDRANEPLLNQASITFERIFSTDPSKFDWGFKTQFMVGSDARFTHTLGMFDESFHETVEPDIVEAYANLHFPVITKGGLDLKLGKFVTMEGAETIDPRTNVFYSHSYIFNFGIPLLHTGALFTLHTTDWLNVMAGVTRGVNTSIEDNNGSAAFHGGLGVTLLSGSLTALASVHAGPEDPHDNHDWRYLNDITITYKINDKLTSITDLNYIRDEGSPGNADGGGFAQYFTYALNDWCTLGIREEIWRDDEGFFVAQFAANDDFVNIERGTLQNLDPRTVGGGRTTYNELTIGATFKVPLHKPLVSLSFRPEIRWDTSLSGTHPFNDSQDKNQFTFGVDGILEF